MAHCFTFPLIYGSLIQRPISLLVHWFTALDSCAIWLVYRCSQFAIVRRLASGNVALIIAFRVHGFVKPGTPMFGIFHSSDFTFNSARSNPINPARIIYSLHGTYTNKKVWENDILSKFNLIRALSRRHFNGVLYHVIATVRRCFPILYAINGPKCRTANAAMECRFLANRLLISARNSRYCLCGCL